MTGTTNYPAALDTFPDIDATTQEDAEGFEHDIVHNNEAAAIAALQAKVGVNASDDEASVDHRIYSLETGGMNVDDRVDEYADLPSPPPDDKTNYYVNADRLVYVWDGSAWPAEGDGINGGASAIIEFDTQVTIIPGQIAMPADKITLVKVRVGAKNYMMPVWAFDENDPYYANVVALTFFDGANGSTGVVDVKGAVWEVVGAGAVDTSNKPFTGVNSFRLPSNSGIKTTLASPIGDQDYTFETMIYIPSTGTRSEWWRLFILNNGNNSQGNLQLSNNSTTSPPDMRGIINNNSIIMWSNSASISYGVWHHVEYSRQGNVYRYFLDGVLRASYTSATAHNFTNTVLGINGTPDQATGINTTGDGNYGMVRITVGVARHTANFTPPYARYQTS